MFPLLFIRKKTDVVGTERWISIVDSNGIMVVRARPCQWPLFRHRTLQMAREVDDSRHACRGSASKPTLTSKLSRIHGSRPSSLLSHYGFIKISCLFNYFLKGNIFYRVFIYVCLLVCEQASFVIKIKTIYNICLQKCIQFERDGKTFLVQ